MQIELPKELAKKVDKASRLLGIREKELVDRALLVYLDSLSKYLDLKKEMQTWDSLSDEALKDFEK